MSFRATRTRTPLVRDGDPTELTMEDLEVAFLRWLDGRARSDLLHVGPPSSAMLLLEHALGRLRTSTEPLTPRRAHRLGLGHDASIAVAADRLLDVRLAPQGPRCRSFRSASYYLYGLARIDEDDLSVHPDPTASGPVGGATRADDEGRALRGSR